MYPEIVVKIDAAATLIGFTQFGSKSSTVHQVRVATGYGRRHLDLGNCRAVTVRRHDFKSYRAQTAALPSVAIQTNI